MDILEWLAAEIKPGDKVEILYTEVDQPPTRLISERFIEPEAMCGFCRRKKSDVPLLIEKDFMHRICSDCVKECLELMKEYEKI